MIPNTPPDTPSNPVPGNAATNVAPDIGLSWSGGDPDPGDMVKYDVYFSTDNPPVDKAASGLSQTSFQPGGLMKSETYYWRVAAFDQHGATTYGPVWRFTTIPQTYSITTSVPGGNGTISPTSAVVIKGADHTFTFTPISHYHVGSVLVDGVSVGAPTSYTFNNVTAAHTLQATFDINNYTITTMIDLGSGTISPASASVNYGESPTFTFTPSSGYRLSGIKVDGASQPLAGSYTFTNVSADHTLSASFNNTSRPIINSNTGLSYQTLQAAYDAASTGDIIKCRDFLFAGDFTANREGVTVTIDGGYNTSGFDVNPNKSAIDGVVAISNGTVTMMNFAVTD